MFSSGDLLNGKYRIVRPIGVGGMAVVYCANDEALGRDVAIKVLRPAQRSRQEVVDRFRREARVMSSVSDPHVVQVFEVAELEDGTPFIVTELLRGWDLRTLMLERSPLPITDVVDYVMQACEGTAAVHAGGFVHRDLKPQNLFLTVSNHGRPVVKILDFGICKVVEADDGLSTMALSTLGTPRYMSPEQIRSSKFTDARTDIWALGVILFELLTKEPPFQAESQAGVLGAVLSDAPRSLRTLRPDAPAELEEVVRSALAKEKEDRFGSADELREALAPFGSPATRLMDADLRARLMAPPPPVSLPEDVQKPPVEPDARTVLERGRTGPVLVSPPPRASWPAVQHLMETEMTVRPPKPRAAGTAWWTRLGIGVALALALAAIAWSQSQARRPALVQEDADTARTTPLEAPRVSDHAQSAPPRVAAPVVSPLPYVATSPHQAPDATELESSRSTVTRKRPARLSARADEGALRPPARPQKTNATASQGTSATTPPPAAKFDNARPLHL